MAEYKTTIMMSILFGIVSLIIILSLPILVSISLICQREIKDFWEEYNAI